MCCFYFKRQPLSGPRDDGHTVSVGPLAYGVMSINLSVLFSLRTAPGSKGGEVGRGILRENIAVNGNGISVLLMTRGPLGSGRWGGGCYVSRRDTGALSHCDSSNSGNC